jgi:hypothetical protein
MLYYWSKFMLSATEVAPGANTVSVSRVLTPEVAPGANTVAPGANRVSVMSLKQAKSPTSPVARVFVMGQFLEQQVGR